MKKLLFLSSLLNVLIFYGCKTNISDTSFLVETNGKSFYLFGLTTGKDKTPVICRFICSNLPTQQTKEQLCNSPIYIEKLTLEKSKDLSIFLEDIESLRINVRQVTETEKNTINSLYSTKEKTGTYDADIGTSSEVCDPLLKPTNTKTLPVLSVDESHSLANTNSIKVKDLFSCSVINSHPYIERKNYYDAFSTTDFGGVLLSGNWQTSSCIKWNFLRTYYNCNSAKEKDITPKFDTNKVKLEPNPNSSGMYSVVTVVVDNKGLTGEDSIDINSTNRIILQFVAIHHEKNNDYDTFTSKDASYYICNKKR